MPFHHLAYASGRREHRDEVHFRIHAIATDSAAVPLVVVNLSPHGLMARCGSLVQPGTKLVLPFPDVTRVTAEVRWALGGRIGCEFDVPFAPATYYRMLARLIA